MRPPVCDVCDRDQLGTVQAGGPRFVTRQFADYTPLPNGMAGHPEGLLWLCPECDAATTDLRQLVSREAIRIARQRRGLRPNG